MKSKSLFWGLFLITLGALYLLDSYANFYIDWYSISEWWPIIFIFWGLCVIFKKHDVVRPIITGVTGFWLALILYTLFFNSFNCNYDFDFDFNDSHHNVQNYIQEYDKTIDEAKLIVNAGAGKFLIQGTTNDLVKAKAYSSWGDYDFDFFDSRHKNIIEISQTDAHLDIFDLDDDLRNKLEVKLNEHPLWDIDINIGAASSFLDLIDQKVRRLDLNTGATKTRIRLGERFEETDVNVEMGAASLTVEIPKNSGCKLTGERVLVFKDIDGFRKDSDRDYYITNNFEKSKNKIYLNVDGGVASLNIKRY